MAIEARALRAFTLMEVNLAIFIMAAGVLGLVSLYSLGFRESSQSEEDVAAAGLADVFFAPLVAKLSDTNLTWTAWCNVVKGGTGEGAYDGLLPQNGWEDYVTKLNDNSESSLNAYRIKKTSAEDVVGEILGANVSGSDYFSYPTKLSSEGYAYGLVATRKGPTISLAFRASRRPQALLSQPVYYTEVHFQGKADE